MRLHLPKKKEGKNFEFEVLVPEASQIHDKKIFYMFSPKILPMFKYLKKKIT